MFKTESELIQAISDYASEINKTPTIENFAKKYNLFASSIIRSFGSWNILLKKAGLKINKSNKRTDQQLLLWLKSHPEARYAEIPYGIRNKLEQVYGTISDARVAAGLRIIDWRSATKRRKYIKNNAGRPIEYTEERIIKALQDLTIKLGKPPRAKDITKENCGFTISVVIARFGSFNNALNAASIPLNCTHQEISRLLREFEILMMNIKIATNDIPKYFKLEVDGYSGTFIYENRIEDVYLTRSDIFLSINAQKYKDKKEKYIVHYLIDDTLSETSDALLICAMDLFGELEISNKILAEKLLNIRKNYDDVKRLYIGQPIINQ